MGRAVLVTGTSGFLGGALGRHLRAAGYRVTGLSRRAARPGSVDDQVRHDLSAPLPETVPSHEIIVHAAALASPWASPAAYHDHILRATQHVLDYADRAGAGYVILISTTAVFYRLADQYDITEDTPLPAEPINGYAAAKRAAEALFTARRPEGLIIRPRAIYGPGDTVLFPRVLRAARKGLLPRILRPDGGSAVADLVYVGNLVHAIEAAIRLRLAGSVNVTDGCPQDTFLLLTGVLDRLGYPRPRLSLSLDQAMRMAGAFEWLSAHLFGWREPPITRFGVSAVAHAKTFDVGRMLTVLGRPPFTPEQGLSAFVDWQRAGARP